MYNKELANALAKNLVAYFDVLEIVYGGAVAHEDLSSHIEEFLNNRENPIR